MFVRLGVNAADFDHHRLAILDFALQGLASSDNAWRSTCRITMAAGTYLHRTRSRILPIRETNEVTPYDSRYSEL